MKLKGQTFVEVVVALAVLAIAVVTMMEALNVGVLGAFRVQNVNAAMELARSQMEYIKLQDFQVCSNESGYCTDTSIYGKVVELPPGFNSSDIKIDVRNIDGEADGNTLQEVNVSVSYARTNWVNVTAYKAPRLSKVFPTDVDWWIVTNNISVPDLPGGGLFSCGWGYYYTFETGVNDKYICSTWVYRSDEKLNIADLYLYAGMPFGPGQGKIKECPPDVGRLEHVSSWWNEDTEVFLATMQSDPQPAGHYTVYFYNWGLPSRVLYTTSASVTYYW